MKNEFETIVTCENGHHYYQTEDGRCPECLRTEHRRIQIEEPAVRRQVAGWLVCLSGASKGRDFAVMEENNFIGRGETMDICLSDCPSVSAKNHSCICYDSLEKVFYYLPQSGRGIDYINGSPVFEPQELNDGDLLVVGSVRFIFSALCGSKFSWEDLQNEQ